MTPAALAPMREATSLAGRWVRLTEECTGGYDGAQPYYHVAYGYPSVKAPRLSRYTPFLDRAETLFELLAQDVTDPAELAPPPGPLRAWERNGNRGVAIGIAGHAEPPSGTRINTDDPEGVSVTPGLARPGGGRPRRYQNPAEGNRARQRAYRARHRAALEMLP